MNEDPKYYKKLTTAISKAIKDIQKNDSHVTAVEIHGPHSGYTIEFLGFEGSSGKPSGKFWKSTPIEK